MNATHLRNMFMPLRGRRDDWARPRPNSRRPYLTRRAFRDDATGAATRPYSTNRLNRSALEITDTELNVMAALAMRGLRSNPKNG